MSRCIVASDLGHLVHDHKVDDEPPGRERPFRLLAEGDVRCVGEPIAMVIADNRYRAEDALDVIVIDIDIEEPVVDPIRALDADAPLVQPTATSNVYGRDSARREPDARASCSRRRRLC